MADCGLIEAITSYMRVNNLGLRSAAAQIGISHPTLSKVLDGGEPTFDFCIKVSHFLGVSPTQVLRLGGLLPPVPEGAEWHEKLMHLFDQMTDDKKQNIIDYAEFLLLKK